jgi:hypothetical protein
MFLNKPDAGKNVNVPDPSIVYAPTFGITPLATAIVHVPHDARGKNCVRVMIVTLLTGTTNVEHMHPSGEQI